MHTVPQDPRINKANFFDQEHFQKVRETHLPVVSDVFMSARGFVSVALCMPVLRNGAFEGTITVMIPFDELARTYLEGIKISDDGYSWMLDRKGVELYCSVRDYVGKTIFENCRGVPSILSIAEQMIQGKEGQTTYVSDQIRARGPFP